MMDVIRRLMYIFCDTNDSVGILQEMEYDCLGDEVSDGDGVKLEIWLAVVFGGKGPLLPTIL